MTTSSLLGGTFQKPYSTRLSASGGNAPYSLTATGLPKGLSVNGQMISGTPTEAGAFFVTITAQDNTSSTNGGPFTSAASPLTLTIAPGTVTVTTVSLINATYQTAYTANLGASGGSGSYSFTATGLPLGLSANGATISGTPTQAGTFSVTIIATDNTTKAVSAAKSLTLTVTAPTVTVSTGSLPVGTKGTSYGASLTAAGGSGSYSFTVTGLPPGLSATGGSLISGVPTQSGAFPVSIIATDTTSSTNGGPFKSAPRSLTLTITVGKPVSS